MLEAEPQENESQPATNEAPEEKSDEEIWAEGGAELQSVIDSDPKVEEHVLGALGRRLSDGIDAQSWGKVLQSVRALLGGEARTIFLWPAMTDDEAERERRLTEVETHLSAEAARLIRVALASYGDELWTAYDISDQFPDNWRRISREVYYDTVSERFVLKFLIAKFNGEQVVLEGPAESMLNLARSIVVSLARVEAPDAFSPGSTQEFLNEVEPLLRMLRREPAPAVDGAAEPSTVGG